MESELRVEPPLSSTVGDSRLLWGFAPVRHLAALEILRGDAPVILLCARHVEEVGCEKRAGESASWPLGFENRAELIGPVPRRWRLTAYSFDGEQTNNATYAPYSKLKIKLILVKLGHACCNCNDSGH